MREYVLHESGEKQAVTLAAGEELTIVLRENPTTGYRWELELTGGAVSLAGSEYKPAVDAIGGGGERRFRLTARSAGVTAVRARLRRPWETETAPLEERVLDVHVVQR
jgi:inhibitor of cysteine peptidase